MALYLVVILFDFDDAVVKELLLQLHISDMMELLKFCLFDSLSSLHNVQKLGLHLYIDELGTHVRAFIELEMTGV